MSLESRIAQLECQQRTWKAIVIGQLLVVGLVLSCTSPNQKAPKVEAAAQASGETGGARIQAGATADIISARQLRIVDENGKTVVSVQADKEGGNIALFNAAEKQLVTVKNDVLEILVALQDPLRFIGDAIVLFAHDVRRERGRARFERVDRRIDTERCELTRECHGRIEVREGRRWCGVGKVVGRHVDGLH